MDEKKLTADTVSEVFRDCLYDDAEVAGMGDDELLDHAVFAKGLTIAVGFNPNRLKERRPDVKALLNQLPESFHADSGGGMSFLEMCADKAGEQWGSQQSAQELMLLGLASGLAKYCAPRELWPSLPGGVPYVVVQTDAGSEDDEEGERDDS